MPEEGKLLEIARRIILIAAAALAYVLFGSLALIGCLIPLKRALSGREQFLAAPVPSPLSTNLPSRQFRFQDPLFETINEDLNAYLRQFKRAKLLVALESSGGKFYRSYSVTGTLSPPYSLEALASEEDRILIERVDQEILTDWKYIFVREGLDDRWGVFYNSPFRSYTEVKGESSSMSEKYLRKLLRMVYLHPPGIHLDLEGFMEMESRRFEPVSEIR